jgi:hypothetical protein
VTDLLLNGYKESGLRVCVSTSNKPQIRTRPYPDFLHGAFSAISFAFMTILMSGINMYSMALVMKVVLGKPELQHLAFFPGSRHLRGSGRPAVCNFQEILIWAGALLVPILGMIEESDAADPNQLRTVTEPRSVHGLDGLVMGVTTLPTKDKCQRYQEPISWGGVVACVFVVLNIMLW